MKIQVTREENRPISFTNKEAAYYYTQSHENNHEEYAEFAGMNIAQNRVFGGYDLFIDDKKINYRESEVWVYPHKLVRKHQPDITEEFWLFDYKNIIEISLKGTEKSIDIALKGEGIDYLGRSRDTAFYLSREGDYIISVSPKIKQPIEVNQQRVCSPAGNNGFYISVAEYREKAASLIRQTRQSVNVLKNERKERIEKLLSTNGYISSNDNSLDKALNWINVNLDQLITHQHGYGIYAGLPWFNEYWGRDEFISMPGAVLVNGEFETARKILKSFAQYQEMDKESKFYGRVPNTVNPWHINYRTSDGTPHFVIQMQEYVQYSGDLSLIKELYPNVKSSINGALKNWVDDNGYLTHEDHETWMDAWDTEKVPYTPRGNRANDIQRLWYKQLLAGVYFANYVDDNANAERWQQTADKVRTNFREDFVDKNHNIMADRLTKNDEADFTLRPNQLFALDMIEDQTYRWKVTRKAWEELVYPWGISSLSYKDENFHPYHLSDKYPKAAAYHAGAIWPWVNGIAMQRMIEAGQTETAFQLFQNVNNEALTRGVVGGLSENLNAYPHEKNSWPRPTGTYLQAWSNAEHLRVWYQHFLGIHPDLIENKLSLAPRIPEDITNLDYNFTFDHQLVKSSYTASEKEEVYRYTFKDSKLTATVNVFPYKTKEITVSPDSTLQLTATSDLLKMQLIDDSGKIITETKAGKSQSKIDRRKDQNEIFEGVEFAQPRELERHAVLE